MVKARKRAKAPKRTQAPKATWSKWITDTYAPEGAGGLCTDGKAALIFASALEKAGKTPDEVWEITPEAWKEKVVEACQEDNVYEDTLEALNNADSYLPGNTPKEVSAALATLIVEVEKLHSRTNNADTSNTPTLAVQGGTVVIASWS